jgi:ech hydrogenase subunit F
MTPNIVRNFFTKRATRRYPFEQRPPFEDARGELYIDIEECNLCSLCARACPAQCIAVDREKGTWECDPFECVYCGVCEDVCSRGCLHFKERYREPATSKFLMHEQGEIKKKPKKEETATEKTAQ